MKRYPRLGRKAWDQVKALLEEGLSPDEVCSRLDSRKNIKKQAHRLELMKFLKAFLEEAQARGRINIEKF